MHRTLFVCLGNICRSPLAEGIYLHLIRERGWEHRFHADSAGMGSWHCGEPPDPRALETASRRGIHLPSVCRQVARDDFEEFDLILAMDRSNRDALLSLCPAPWRGKIRLMRDFDPETRPEAQPEVPDPYHGNAQGFDRVFDMLDRSCRALLARLDEGHPERKPGRPASHGGPEA